MPARKSSAKVAEYQRRGVVHFHAVIRLDGPDGPTTPPPAWATGDLLDDAVRHAAHAVTVTTPEVEGVPSRALAWGAQVDVRPITTTGELTDQAVAGYIAKYATKAAECDGTLDALREARMAFNQRGHHTTTGRLPLFDDDQVLVIAHWDYVGQGHTPGEAFLCRAQRQATATAHPGHRRRDHDMTKLLLTVPEAATARGPPQDQQPPQVRSLRFEGIAGPCCAMAS